MASIERYRTFSPDFRAGEILHLVKCGDSKRVFDHSGFVVSIACRYCITACPQAILDLGASPRGNTRVDEYVQLNADLLDIEELERRIEASQVLPLGDMGGDFCVGECNCVCRRLVQCDTFCV
jgi:hypothetical protein